MEFVPIELAADHGDVLYKRQVHLGESLEAAVHLVSQEEREAMAGTVNKVILIGRLGADPDVRYMADGTPVVTFNMATDEPILSAEGNWEKRPEWHRIVARRKLAENMANFLSKGRLVYVEGKLQTRQWQDNQGIKRYTTEIVAREIHLLDSAGSRPAQSPTGENYNKAGIPPSSGSRSEMEELPPPPDTPDSEIPF